MAEQRQRYGNSRGAGTEISDQVVLVITEGINLGKSIRRRCLMTSGVHTKILIFVQVLELVRTNRMIHLRISAVWIILDVE